MNAKEEGDHRHLMQEVLPIIAQEDPHDSLAWSTKIH
jgi:hypothetical protein